MAFCDAENYFTGGWVPYSGPLFRHNMDTAINMVMFDGHSETIGMEQADEPPRQVVKLDPLNYNVYPWEDPPP